MVQDEADPSDDDSCSYTATNVLLGYASKEPTNDLFSQLGGRPTWPTSTSTPSSTLARCKCCNSMMTLLLQLFSDVPDNFADHERRLYIFSCKRKACRRKDGSLRVIRGTKRATRTQEQKDEAAIKAQHRTDDTRRKEQLTDLAPKLSEPERRLGDMIFNHSSQPTSTPAQNPFAKHEGQQPDRPLDGHYHRPLANPFATASNGGPVYSNTNPLPPSAMTSTLNEQSSSSTTQQPDPQNLSTTFAQKARISSSASSQATPVPKTPWPSSNDLPPPYPTYHIDADYETLDPSPPASASKTSNMEIDPSNSTTANNDDILDKDAFESSLDKTFLHFADRAAQNPEQVLRYEYGGQPLLYSTTDAVGKMLSSSLHHDPRQDRNTSVKVVSAKAKATTATRFLLPPCGNCGAARVFEVQLMPEAIAQLEAEEEGLDGMDWGTVIVGTCGADCGEVGIDVDEGEWGWVEEWAGVQWEEVSSGKPGR